jgi:hypothetical protein
MGTTKDAVRIIGGNVGVMSSHHGIITQSFDIGQSSQPIQHAANEIDGRPLKSHTGASGRRSRSSGPAWRGADPPHGFRDITEQVEKNRCDLMNVNVMAGPVRVLFDESKPSGLGNSSGGVKDWVESYTDEQLMLFMPFQSMVKLHTLQVRIWLLLFRKGYI